MLRISATVTSKQGFRNPDAIAGGAWEAFERVMQRHGYFSSGLRKIEAARNVAAHFDPVRSSSRSFQCFHDAISEALA